MARRGRRALQNDRQTGHHQNSNVGCCGQCLVRLTQQVPISSPQGGDGRQPGADFVGNDDQMTVELLRGLHDLSDLQPDAVLHLVSEGIGRICDQINLMYWRSWKTNCPY